TVTLTPRDSHNNVVPLWTFRKDLTIVPSVNATVPGAVTVTTPAQDAAGAVTATLTYVDTSGQLLSKAARTGSTTVSIGSAVKKTFDTRFYPQVNVCLTNLDSNGYVTPGTTKVRLCDGSGHSIQSGSGYTTTAPGISSSGCPANGGGVCPSDTANVEADFENLTGDDIRTLAGARVTFIVHDSLAGLDMKSTFTTGEIAFYGELRSHMGTADLGTTKDLFHTDDANAYCSNLVRRLPDGARLAQEARKASSAVLAGAATGGSATGFDTKGFYMGDIAKVIHTGGDTNPEIFVAGIGWGTCGPDCSIYDPHEVYRDRYGATTVGAKIPSALVFVNGSRSAAASWAFYDNDGTTVRETSTGPDEISFGYNLHTDTGWNLSDAYFVNNWPGTPYTLHKGNGDSAYHYVTQVNYITGYICAASLH
ncbi:hypothetical protein, partial [Salmonella enterica]|uniref:hypothetical protein n=1 Tax=Salmonella enterica TaxID=28901 RepID=UPI0021B15F2F